MEQNKRRAEEFGTEFEEKVLYVNRCCKAVKGGKKFSFSALVLVGDRQGRVGFGFAKANEVSDAIRKATGFARENILTFEMEGFTIPHEILVHWDGCIVLLKPARDGIGVIAGSKVRSVLELAGVKDVVAKIYGSNNPLNQVQATFAALERLVNRQKNLENRGLAS
ncbi:30S ribosomal protein S5 [Candidatus Rhabdochlamydia porcellionis]|jgi:small subunit ribosomal protein S5|uniref:Small ribosomal subunit protein uS5 n=1 Tax=Candidatus Rhabdochlamydia porcellionis TaxID=225148 RepID=A0A1K0JNM8_9BACT|nr:30S ribosomal protein S5 [Candidatus Rhabdochlamydia porcellionis]QZA58320.1 30S ribosomal protein S5 [Candidatus Rhabdochlamydia porcellionis]SDA08638.1 30S ribosomal protein S5 [Candidatus Rhabdochlamydia porcellionis]